MLDTRQSRGVAGAMAGIVGRAFLAGDALETGQPWLESHVVHWGGLESCDVGRQTRIGLRSSSFIRTRKNLGHDGSNEGRHRRGAENKDGAPARNDAGERIGALRRASKVFIISIQTQANRPRSGPMCLRFAF